MEHKRRVETYVNGVLSGKVTAGKLVKAACRRYMNDLETAAARGYYFDEQTAESACDFFSLLRMTSGEYAGKPFELRGFQSFIVWNLTGWKRESDDMRRFRDAFISVGRGNGKTPLLAGLLLLFFGFDNPIEADAECIIGATKFQQAWKYTFSDARKFVEQSPGLADYIQVTKYKLNIPSSGATFEPIGSDSKGLDSMRLHAVGIDELHAMREQHREMIEKIRTALGKRRQPICITTTTAGNEESEMWEREHAFSAQVATGIVESDTHFSFIAEIDEEDDVFDEACWPKANPMLVEPNSPVKIDHIRQMAAKAKVSPSERNQFVRYHCNRFVTSSAKLISRELWQQCGILPLPDDMSELDCYVGFDWGWRDDIAAIGYVWPVGSVEVDGILKQQYAIGCDAFLPRDGHRSLVEEPWRSWIEQGWLIPTPGETTDTELVFKTLQSRCDEYYVRSVAFDKWNAREFGTKCEAVLGLPTFAFSQNCRTFNEPLREFELAVRERRIIHGNNPVLGWAATNMIAKEDASGHKMPEKKRSLDKIDPIVAVIMALSEAMFAANQAYFYDDNDLEVAD